MEESERKIKRPRRVGLVVILVILGSLAALACEGPPPGYRVSGYKVTYTRWQRKARNTTKAIEGADPATFKVLNSDFAKDKARVYCKGTPIAEAEPESFEVLDEHELLTRDQNHVYWGHDIITRDVENFQILGDYYYKDSEHVYDPYFQRIPEMDSATLKVFGWGYVGDAKSVLYLGKPVPGADPSTLQTFSVGSYAKDANKVFYQGHWLKEADNATFTVVDGVAQDALGEFEDTRRVSQP